VGGFGRCVPCAQPDLTRDTSSRTYHRVTQVDPGRHDPSPTPFGGSTDEASNDGRNAGDGATAPAQAPASQDGEGPREAKKERVLHTRVPAVLERELKRFADNLRVPVSNLVRTILEDALSVADAATESVEERLRRAAERLEREREKLKKRMEHDPLSGIVAFQEVTLAMPAACVKCQVTIPRGARAHLGIGDRSDDRLFVCESCRPRG
jgi:hypothetical protein